MKTENNDCYLLIESKYAEKTSGFYKCLGFDVVDGYELGDYLVFTKLGYITINQTDLDESPSMQSYKPIINIDLEREQINQLVRDMRGLGSRVTEIGEFLNLSIYECEDFSGGVICLQIGIKN